MHESWYPYIERQSQIHQLAPDAISRTFLDFWSDRRPGEMNFVLRAHLHVKQDELRPVEAADVTIWPGQFEPASATPPAQPMQVERILGGGIKIDDTDAADVAAQHRTILRYLPRIQQVTDGLAVLADTSIRWRPARLLTSFHSRDPFSAWPADWKPDPKVPHTYFAEMQPGEELTARVVSEEWVSKYYRDFLRHIDAVPNEAFRLVIWRAIAWRAEGLRNRGLGRYIHYWATVELLASYLYKNLDSELTGATPASERNQRILEQFLDLNGKNYLSVARAVADLLEPSTRTTINAISKVIEFECDPLFARDAKAGKKSLLGIRNDLAHGNTGASDYDYLLAHREELENYGRVTEGFLLRVISKAHWLAARFQVAT